MVDTWNAAQLNEAANNGSIGGGGSSLPSVTISDNGKILGVVEGAWGKMDAPGVTTVLYNPEEPTSISSTASDITLSAAITGFDYILLTLGNNPGRGIAIATPEDLESTDGCSCSSGSSQEWEYSVDSTDHVTLSIACGGSGRLLHKVVGIKL